MINLGKPKTKYYLKRILPFGIIWLALSWFVLLIESMATDYENKRPETDITVDWAIFLFASFAVFMVGIAMGNVEGLWLGKQFKSKSFGSKILYKMGFYLLFMLAINCITFPLAASIEMGTFLLDSGVWDKFSHYIVSSTFLSTMVSLSFSIFVSLLYSGISEHLEDVLNVTARIQKLCKTYGKELLVSGQLKDVLKKKGPVHFETMGTMELEGRKKPAVLFYPLHP